MPGSRAAAAVRDALSSFSIHYADNVERSFCGRPLVPCVPGGFAVSALDVADSTLAHVRMACKGIAAAVLAGVAVSAAMLVNGAQASLYAAGYAWSGGVSGVVVAVAALFPALVGLSLRFGGSRTTAGFLRGTAGLAVMFAALWQVLADMRFEEAAQQHLLSMALVAAVAAGWCIMVADFALNVALPQMIRRKALPSGDRDGVDALPAQWRWRLRATPVRAKRGRFAACRLLARPTLMSPGFPPIYATRFAVQTRNLSTRSMTPQMRFRAQMPGLRANAMRWMMI